MYSNDINDLHNYAHFLLRGIYHNYIHSETGIAISRLLIFIIFITFIIYAKYDYLLGFIVVVVIIEVMSASSTAYSSSSWLDIWSEIAPLITHNNNNNQISPYRSSYTFDINNLTNGITLNTKEGFEIFGISRSDDSGTDYHNRNTSVDKNSQEFSDKFFENKKCNNGIGSIIMSGTNELIGKRSVYMSSTYDYANKLKLIKAQTHINNITINNINKNDVSNNDQFQQYCYNYFFDCVYEPINRSRKASGNTIDFRKFKTDIYNGINDNIMKIDDLLGRFNLHNLKDASDNRIVGNIINKNKDKDTNNELYNINEINDKSDAQFGDFIDKESIKTDIFKARRLEIYNQVYQYKKKLNEIFTNWKNHSEKYNINVNFVSVNDNVLNDLSEIINFIRLVKMSYDIVIAHDDIFLSNPDNKTLYGLIEEAKTNNVKKMLPYGYSNAANKITRDTNFATTNKILSGKNIYEIPQSSAVTSYTLPDEERFLYGISYFYNNISH